MRTYEEIAERCRKPEAFLEFDIEALIIFVPHEHAKGFLKPETVAEEWDKEVIPLTREEILKVMSKYMKFAWGKVEDHRGLSAERSVDKMGAWVWLLGDDEVLARMEAAEYAMYGAPKLKVVCETYGFDIPQSSDIKNMCEGSPCCTGCEQGCG